MNITKGLSVTVKNHKKTGGLRILLTITNAIPRYDKRKTGRRVIRFADYHGKLPFKVAVGTSEFQPRFVLKIYCRAKSDQAKAQFDSCHYDVNNP